MAIWVNGNTYLTTDAIEAVLPTRLSDTELRAALAPKVKTKRVTMPISSTGGGGTLATSTDFCQRSAILLPVKTTRWRMRVGNANASANTVPAATGTINLMPTYVGAPSYSGTDGSWAGAFAAAPAQALPSASVPTDGTDWVSPWVTDAALQFAADTPSIISWGATTTGAQALVTDSCRIAWSFTGVGSAAAVGAAAKPGTTASNKVTLLDVRIEYETVTDLPVVLICSDSTGAGQIDDDAFAPNVPGPHITWAGQAALRHRFLPVNASLPGAPTLTFYGRPVTAPQWTRFDLATTPPEVAVLGLGINDVNASTTLPVFRSRTGSLKDYLTTNFGIKRFVQTTVMAQPRWAAASVQDNLRITYNDAIRGGIKGIEEVVDFARAFAVTDDLTHWWGTGTIHPGIGASKVFGNLARV